MLILALLIACGSEAPPEPVATPAPQVVASTLTSQQKAGRRAFREHCQGCHGLDAAGDGPAAASLEPHPGDLRRSSLAPGKIERIIREGIPDSSMRAFGDELEDEEIAAIAAWLVSLQPRAG